MKSSDIPSRFPIPFAKNATSSYVRTIPETTADPDAASLDLGWPPATGTPVGSGGSPPDIRDANGILKLITQWSQWGNAGGPVGYDSSFSSSIAGYPKGSILAAATFGNFWISTADDNTTDPDSGGAGWAAFSPLPLTGTDTGTANAAVVTLPATFSAISSLVGIPVAIKKISSANTASITVTLKNSDGTSLGTKAVVHTDGSSLLAGELPGNCYFVVIYDGTFLQLQTAANPSFLQQQKGNYAVDSGTTNAVAVTLTPALVSHVIGMPIRVKVSHTNSGATTFNPGPGAVPVYKRGRTGTIALSGSELVAGTIQEFVYDGSVYEVTPVTTFPSIWFSGQQTFTRGATAGPFSLGGVVTNPNLISGSLVCVSADIGFSVGDIVGLPGPSSGDDGTGCTAYIRSGSLYFSVSTTGIELIRPDTNARAALTESHWRAVFVVQGTN